MKISEPKYSLKFKTEVCDYALKESIQDSSVIYGVHRNTVGRWLTKYKKSGTKGFIVKRNDTQTTKLDKEKLVKIKKYKILHPEATLKELKRKFDVECGISLISRKLKKVMSKKKTYGKKDCVYLKLRTIKNAIFKNQSRSIYRLSLHSYQGKLLSIGFTKAYTSENICLFLRYSLEKLLQTGRKFKIKSVITGLIYIKKADFDDILGKEFNVELKSSVKKAGVKVRENDFEYERKINVSDSISESYEKILLNYKHTELDNILLTSIVNVDRLKKEDTSTAEWSTLLMPAETKESIYGLLKKIKESGDAAAMNFDYDKAKSEYNKAYSALFNLEIDTALSVSVLIKRAVLFYNSREHHLSLMLFLDAARIAKRNHLTKELTECYFYIGIILVFFQDIKRASGYFEKSARILRKYKDPELKSMYYRSEHLKYFLSGDYIKSERYSEIYNETVLKTGNTILIGQCLSLSRHYLVQMSRFKEYEQYMLKAKEYNIANGNYYDVIGNISNLMYLYIDPEKGIEGDVNSLLKDFKFYALKLNMPSLVHHANFQTGLYYSNISEYSEAEKILSCSLPHIKKKFNKETYMMNLYTLAKVFYEKKQFSKAVRKLNILIDESKKCSNDSYLIDSYIIMSKIFIERNEYKRASGFINKTIKMARKLKEPETAGEFYSRYAELCKKNNMAKRSSYLFSKAEECFNEARKAQIQ